MNSDMKKNVSIILVLVVTGLALFLFWKVYQSGQAKQEARKRSEHLPTVPLVGLDSVAFKITSVAQPTVIFYFDPHCEHCQNEAQALRKQYQAFKTARLLWVSTERLWVLRQFEAQYALQKSISTLQVAQISPEVADKQFGFRTVPTMMIYDSEGHLVKKFVGETKIEALLKYLTPTKE
jgi:peroxiredoxin